MALLGLVLAVVAFVLAGWGSYETYDAPRRLNARTLADAPAWTGPCWERSVNSSRVTTVQCARLRARVVFKTTEDGPQGDVHLVTVSGRRIVYAKISPEDRSKGVPSIGERVTLVGPVTRGAHVDEQVRAFAIRRHGL